MTTKQADDWQHLKAYGYAPGGYMMRCHRCSTTAHDVDKRATTCRPCAEAMHAAKPAVDIKAFAAEHTPALAANITRLCGKVIEQGLVGILEHTCELQQQVMALEKERDALKPDAERYRWLLANYARGDGYTAIDAALNDGEPDTQLSPAVDAAMAASA